MIISSHLLQRKGNRLVCGIFGGAWRPADPPGLEERLDSARRSLIHRGPDDSGVEVLRDRGAYTVALGLTRLAIIDLTKGGHQPMWSADQRFAMVFNGEIFNYVELRSELENLGHRFRTRTDTEVLLTAWQEWGRTVLVRLQGMFAFTVYDATRETLTSVRDAFGIKPFFYSLDGDAFVFASELPALLKVRGGKPHVDLTTAYAYLVHGAYDNTDHSFIDGVRRLQPGHFIEVDLNAPFSAEQRQWWKPPTDQRDDLTFETAAEAVRDQFLSNVRLHLRSDVPLGAALSGGIDSAAIVSAIRHIEPDLPIHTFSYIASGEAFSEEPWVDLVNDHIGAIGHKVTGSGAALLRDLDDLIVAQGEPFGSTSIYAQYRVFQLARENGVVVTLEGQGGDELLAGYDGYPGYRLWSMHESEGLTAAHRFARNWSGWPGRSYERALKEYAAVRLTDSFYARARKMTGRDFQPDWMNNELLREAGVSPMQLRPQHSKHAAGRRVIEHLAYSLQNRGIQGLLRHGDRNSMAFSIESRVPFLTIDMAELLLSLPENWLISARGETKSVFRAALRGIVPDIVLDRKDKIGFEVPEEAWLRHDVPRIRDALGSAGALQLINGPQLTAAFDDVVSGRVPFSWQVWRWFNFARWAEQFDVE